MRPLMFLLRALSIHLFGVVRAQFDHDISQATPKPDRRQQGIPHSVHTAWFRR